MAGCYKMKQKRRCFFINIFIIIGLVVPSLSMALEDSKTSDVNVPSNSLNNDTLASQTSDDWWTFLKGEPQDNSVYLGMVTFHFNQNSRLNDRWNNDLVGGVYKGIFVGTLINSFNDRAYVIGVSRDVYKQKLNENFDMTLGYRLGLISGYDERMTSIAEYTPVLPFPQAYADFTFKNTAGVEISYIGVVLTAEFYIRF